jgi:WD40 repeat protein
MNEHDDETRQIPPASKPGSNSQPDDLTMLTPPVSGSGQVNSDAQTVAFMPASGSGVSRPISSSAGASRAAAAPAPGVRRIGDYDLESEIARGGMGIVYKARQLSLNRPVAFKMILSGQFASAADVERFHVEAEAAAGLDHPNIVPIYEVGAFDGNHFFTMKLIDGRSMAHEMPRLVKAPRDGVRLLVKVCRAIHYAHQHSILHRDLKPANILLDGQGEPHVTDFGLAKRTGGDSQLTQTGTIVGTPSYMAPEQAAPSKVPLTTSADVYSLGAMLYEILTGRPPFKGDSPLDTLMLVINKEAERPRSINAAADRDLETIALKCLEKDPARRYGSAEALAEDLDRWLEGEPILARPIGSAERVVKWAKRRPAIAALAVGIATVTVLGIAGVIWQWREAVFQRGQTASAMVQVAQEAKAAEAARDQEAAQRAAAESARQQETIARTAADQQKAIAVDALTAAERSAYFNNVSLADHEWAANNIGHADQLLAASPAALRNWEWHYLDRLSHVEISSVAAGTRPIVAFAITGDGQRATSIDADLRAWSIDLRDGRVLRTTKLDGAPGLEVNSTSLSPDGSRFAATTVLITRGLIQQSTFVWDVATGRVVLARGGQSLTEDNAVALFPAGDRLVTAALGTGAAATPIQPGDLVARASAVSSSLRVWDVRTGDELPSLGVVSGVVSTLRLSRDGSRLAVSAKQVASPIDVVVLDVGTGKPIGTLGHSGDTKAVFAPDGQTIAAGTTGGVRVWAASGGTEHWTFAGEAGITSFSPDGTDVVAAMADRSIVVLDAGTGRLKARLLGSAASVTGVSVTASGKAIVSADAEHLRTFMVPPEAAALLAQGPVDTLTAAAVTPDGHRLVGLARGTLRGWDLASGKYLYGPASAPAPGDQTITAASQAIANAIAANSGQPVAAGNRMVFSADGRRTALVKTTFVTVGGVRQSRNGVRVYDTQTGQEVLAFNPASDPPGARASTAPAAADVITVVSMGLGLDRSGQHVALATMKASVGMSRGGTSAASSPVAGGPGLTIRGSDIDVWSAPTERPTTSIAMSNALTATLELSPDGRTAVSLSADFSNQQAGAVYRIHDLRTSRIIASFKGERESAPISYSRDGRLVAAETVRHTVTVVDLDHPDRPLVLPEHRSTVTRIAFSPDNTRIATLSGQGITLFDARSGTQLLALRESLGPYSAREVIVPGKVVSGATSLVYSDDGRQIVMTSVANDPRGIKVTIKAWDGSAKN